MKELSREELLRILLHMFKCYEYNFINEEFKPPEEGKQAYKQIRKLIQRKVSREFVEAIYEASNRYGLKDVIEMIKNESSFKVED